MATVSFASRAIFLLRPPRLHILIVILYSKLQLNRAPTLKRICQTAQLLEVLRQVLRHSFLIKAALYSQAARGSSALRM